MDAVAMSFTFVKNNKIVYLQVMALITFLATPLVISLKVLSLYGILFQVTNMHIYTCVMSKFSTSYDTWVSVTLCLVCAMFSMLLIKHSDMLYLLSRVHFPHQNGSALYCSGNRVMDLVPRHWSFVVRKTTEHTPQTWRSFLTKEKEVKRILGNKFVHGSGS